MKYLSASVLCVALLITRTTLAGEQGPVMNAKKKACLVNKTECPKEAEVRAKAALALSAAGKHKVSHTATKAGCPKEDCKCVGLFGFCDCIEGSCQCCKNAKDKQPEKKEPQAAQPTYFLHNGILYRCESGNCRQQGFAAPK